MFMQTTAQNLQIIKVNCLSGILCNSLPMAFFNRSLQEDADFTEICNWTS